MLNRAFNIALGLALLLAPLAGWGQGSKWNWLTGNNLRGVKFLKGTNEGWTVGQQGLILHTTDGGDHWDVQNSNTQQDLWGIFFLDQNNGWVTGGYKTCLRTRDGGRNWQVVHTEPSGRSHFKGVCFLDSMVGWVVGPQDSILKSTDGGITWTGRAMGTMNVYFGIDFPDSIHGWAVGYDQGRIAKTTDGGNTWRDTLTNMGDMTSVDFTDTLHGWAVAAGWIAQTIDGGNTWTRTNPTSAFLNGVSFCDSLKGWIVGGQNGSPAIILRTSNGGTSWSSQTYTKNTIFYGVSAVETLKAFVVGPSGSILKTTNGGIGWQILRNLDAQNETMFNLALADTQSGYAVGPYGIVVKTTNGGTIWQSQNLGGTSLWFYGVDSPDPNYSWICGDGGSIYATKNGGASWASQPSGVSWYLNSVDMVDTLFGVAVGGGNGKVGSRQKAVGSDETAKANGQKKTWESPPLIKKWQHIKEGDPETSSGQGPQTQYRVITRTMDGTNWQGQTTSATPLTGVSFANKASGWACGVSGTMIHTSDSGATWQTQNSNVTNTLYWVIFPNFLNGWAVGTGGTIIATTDGGNTWNPQTSNTSIDLFSAAFVDAQRGWVVGDSGIALQTTDGGTTWFFDTTQTKILLYATRFTDLHHGWAIGGFGLTLGFDRGGLWGVETQPEGRRQIAEGRLEQSYPNPMRDNCAIGYWLNNGQGDKETRGQGAELNIYDITGRRIRFFAPLGMTESGRHTVVWDGRDETGKNVPAGVYFYQLRTKEITETKKLVKIQ